jgi:hypothetical protein
MTEKKVRVPTTAALVKLYGQGPEAFATAIDKYSIHGRIELLATVNRALDKEELTRKALGAAMVAATHGLTLVEATEMFAKVEDQFRAPGKQIKLKDGTVKNVQGKSLLNRTFIQYRSNILGAMKLGIETSDFVTERDLRSEAATARQGLAKKADAKIRKAVNKGKIKASQLEAVTAHCVSQHKQFEAWYSTLPVAMQAKLWEAVEPVIATISEQFDEAKAAIEGKNKKKEKVEKAEVIEIEEVEVEEAAA